MGCKACGKCCKGFYLETNLGRVKENVELEGQHLVINEATLGDFIKSAAKTGKIEDVLADYLYIIGRDSDGSLQFSCKKLSEEGKCLVHDKEKPGMCQRFFCSVQQQVVQKNMSGES